MNNIVKKTLHFDININTIANDILIIQRWKYNWLANGFSNWTHAEKKKMHEAFEKEMIQVWNQKARVKPSGNSLFVKKHKQSVFKIAFDIQWVTSFAHWEVEVKKVAPKDHKNRPHVDWINQKILLYTSDVDDVPKQLKPLITQKNIAHEFGHTLGNASGVPNMHYDEYRNNQYNRDFFSDKTSLMNLGMELRVRHFDYVIREINTIIPDTQFTLSL
jgi:hypothetical protein